MKYPYGKRLKELRAQAGLTQKRVAEFLHVAPSTYAPWEQEKRMITINMIFRIGKLYQMELKDFFED